MIIGAGMFSMPFEFYSAGLPVGFFYLFFFGAVFAVVLLLYADVILRTAERHRFVGYAKIYLGNFGFWTSVVTTAIGLILVLTIYLILSVSFLRLILPDINFLTAVAVFWITASIFIFLRIERLANSEFFVTVAMILIVSLIFLYPLLKGGYAVDYSRIDFSRVLLPFGPVLFSLAGRSAISSIVDYFNKNQIPAAAIKKPIAVGTLVPAAVYVLFVAGILRIAPGVSEDAVSGLVGYLPSFFLGVVGILGLLSLWSSYTIIAREIKGIFSYDFRMPQIPAIILVVFLPLALYAAGLQNFLQLISTAGGIFLALESILVILMWRALKTPPLLIKRIRPVILYGIILVFIGGMIYEAAYLVDWL